MSKSVTVERQPTIVSMKAFGDHIIARGSAMRAGVKRPLVIGSHLAELDAALSPTTPPIIVDHGEKGVPALFDVRRAGLRRAVGSARRLRQCLAALSIAEQPFLLDRLRFRERYIIGQHRAVALPSRPNIYQAYNALLGAPEPLETAMALSEGGCIVGVFPSGRSPTRYIPRHLIEIVAAHLKRRDILLRTYVLQDERPDLDGLPHLCTIPRNFGAMVGALKDVSLVISADSMPAHMAEFLQKPVFVLSPVPNPYWLPLSSFQTSAWSLFEDAKSDPSVLDPFVGQIQNTRNRLC